ncbi:MAG: helix-turn-helix domain-containing protein [Acidimicrobiia bacterium]
MTTTGIDRAALVRRAMVDLVAERGIHGTSMSDIAERAGVATGTAYVHYGSKAELLVAAFAEVKAGLGRAAMAGIDLSLEAREIFDSVWRGIHSHLTADPAIARFLVQIEVSPLKESAHAALSGNDPLNQTAQTLSAQLVDLPLTVLYDLCLAPAVRLVASDEDLSPSEIDTLIESCWRAVARST